MAEDVAPHPMYCEHCGVAFYLADILVTPNWRSDGQPYAFCQCGSLLPWRLQPSNKAAAYVTRCEIEHAVMMRPFKGTDSYPSVFRS